jgi:hypothetical protein
MTDNELRKLAEAALSDDARAPAGPWTARIDNHRCRVELSDGRVVAFVNDTLEGDPEDAIAAARTREPELARAVLRLLEERDDLARYKRLVVDEFVKAGPFGHKTLAPFFGRVDRRYEAGE